MATVRDPFLPFLNNHPDWSVCWQRYHQRISVIGETHSSSNGFYFTNTLFGFAGQAIHCTVWRYGPWRCKTLAPVGFKLVRVDLASGMIRDFATNKGKRNTPASSLGHVGLERPVSVKFNKADNELYVLDCGIVQIGKKGPLPQLKSRVIWKITKTKRWIEKHL